MEIPVAKLWKNYLQLFGKSTCIKQGGWLEEDKITDFYSNKINKTIIITEGSTDIDVLSKSLVLLFPEYAHLYSFFDFHSFNPGGGTDNLTRLIKSLAAAEIKNKIIAIFDNDTAGEAEIRKLERFPIKDNIRIIKLPDLDFCKNYPTYGPNGLIEMNINGYASSIELFFGNDVIMKNDKYKPIQWTGYNKGLRRYQGAIIDKEELFKKMKKKFKLPYDPEHDWEPLKILWGTIFQQ